jgi:hypothetical protein
MLYKKQSDAWTKERLIDKEERIEIMLKLIWFNAYRCSFDSKFQIRLL